MQRILIFLAGALFGGAFVFVFLSLGNTEPLRGLPEPQPPLPRVAADTSGLPPPPPPPALPIPAVPAAEPLAVPAETPQRAPPATADVLPLPALRPAPLRLPLDGIKASQLVDTFSDSRSGGRVHDAIDIMAPAGTPVFAVDDGRVVKLFNSVPGGLTVYQFDRGETFAYYYAHLQSYAPALVEGGALQRGDLIGYVGSSGNASAAAPHLHFAVFVLGPEKQWWKGTAINPYPLFFGTE